MSDAVDAGTSGQDGSDYVPVTDATDEDLKAFLETPEDEDGNLVDPESDPEKDKKKKKEVQKLPPEKEEKKAEEKEPKQEEKEEKPKPEEKKKSTEDWAKSQAQLAQKEAYIKTLQNQLGEARKREREALAQLNEKAEALYAENPREAYRAEREIERREANLQQIDAQEQSLHNRARAEAVLAANLSKDDYDMEAAVAMLKRDGHGEDVISMFRKDPLSTAPDHPETLVQAFKRARAESTIQKIVPAAQALIERNDALMKENESLKAQLKRAGINAVSKVQDTLKQTPTLTAARGSNSAKRDLSSFDPITMTREELRAFLQEPD